MVVAISILVLSIGLVVGSFLNVVIMRLHAGTQFVRGRSECDNCKHPLQPWEMVPLFSWLALRGRCSRCKKSISIQHPLVEAVTAIVFLLVYLTHPVNTFTAGVMLLLWFWVIGSFVILAVYDIKWYTLPDRVLLPVMVPAAIILLLQAVQYRDWHGIVGAIAAALLFGGGFYSLAAVSRGRWMGGGDIKLAFVIGLLLGLQRTALVMFLAFLAAAIVGMVLISLKRKSRRDYIPFGPFLIGGTLVAYLWGSSIIHWYINAAGLNLL